MYLLYIIKLDNKVIFEFFVWKCIILKSLNNKLILIIEIGKEM